MGYVITSDIPLRCGYKNSFIHGNMGQNLGAYVVTYSFDEISGKAPI